VLAGARMLNLREVHFTSNKLSDAAMAPLASAIASYALAHVRFLGLGDNRLGPASGRALAEAMVASAKGQPAEVGGGAARALLATQPLQALTTLNLERNFLGNAGIAALAGPLACGALLALEVLVLNHNDADNVAPIDEAVASGGVPNLRRVLLEQKAGVAAGSSSGTQRGAASVAPPSILAAKAETAPAMRHAVTYRRDQSTQTTSNGRPTVAV